MKLHHESGLAILRNVQVRKRIKAPKKRAGRQEAHVFNFYTVMKRIAATAALGALVVAGTLQPAHAQAAAQPPRRRKSTSRASSKCTTPRRRRSPRRTLRRRITDLEAWKQKAPRFGLRG